MSLRRKNGDADYERSPKNTQWEKGQCGNPKRQYNHAAKGTVELIDAAFAEQMTIVENGAARQVSVFEAIFLQICSKEISGSKRATAVRLQYQDFVAQSGGEQKREFIIRHVPGVAAARRSER